MTRVQGSLKMTPVFTGRIHGSRPVNTALEHGYYVPSTRVHGPCWQQALSYNALLRTQPVNTGARYTLPVFTGREHTGYQHGPLTPAEFLGVQNDIRVHGPCVNMGSVYRP